MLLPNVKVKAKKPNPKGPRDYEYSFEAASDEDAIKRAEALLAKLEPNTRARRKRRSR